MTTDIVPWASPIDALSLIHNTLRTEAERVEQAVQQLQPHFYPVTYNNVTHVYHCRATCCRYYLLPQRQYCASCSLLSHEERLQRNHTWMRDLLEPAASL